MTCLTAVLTLKVAVLVNTGFANRKWVEMPIEAKKRSAAKLELILNGPVTAPE
jgi:hypothetical protein